MSSLMMVVPPTINHPFLPQIVVYGQSFKRLTHQRWGVGQSEKKTLETLSQIARKLSQLNDLGPIPEGKPRSD